MGRLLRLFGLAWCSVLLLLPGALYLAGERSDNVENRSLVPFPAWTLTSAFKIATYRAASDAWIDRLPLRDRALDLKGHALIAFGDNPNPTAVVVGTGGWLFITDEVLCDAPGTTTAQFLDQLALARSAALAARKRFAFVIVPAKMTQEERHFGEHHAWETCARERLADLRKRAVGKPGVVDLWAPLDAITAAGGDVFWRTDSHLGPRGKLAYARVLESAIEPARAGTVRIRLGGPSRHLGDITLLTGYKEFETDRPLETRTTPQTPAPASRPNVVIGDSQTEEIQDQLAGAISSFAFCHWDKGFWLGTCDAGLQAAGSITVETVARAIWRRTQPGFGVRLLDALLPVIPSARAPWAIVSGAKPGPDQGGATLTAPHATFRLQAARDTVRERRLIRFKIDATAVGGEPFVQLLIDGKPGTGPMTSIGSAPSNVELVLQVPPGVALERTQVAVGSSPGATVGPARVSALP